MKKFIIVSYYTLDTAYADVMHKYLKPSIESLKLECDIRAIQNLGNWQANTSYKPTFIKQMMEHHKEDIVFVDADAEIIKYPKLFEDIPLEYNFAAHILDRDKWYNILFSENNKKELLSGTLYIRNNAESKKIVDEWILNCTNSQIWEQKILQSVLAKNNTRVFELPVSYCYMLTLPNGKEPYVKVDEIFIQHNQVSRKLRRLV